MALAAAGYSGTPLAKKLGFKDGQRVAFLGLPEELKDLKAVCDFAAAKGVTWAGLKKTKGFDVVHVFTKVRAELEDNAGALMKAIASDGMVWISWPKKASKVKTDITEDVLRDIFLPIGLVDVKVCAIDEIWSGLKFVIRKELR